MKVFLDVNVVLDVLLDRQPWVASARALWKACDEGRATGYVSAISLPTLFYIVRKAAGLDNAFDAIDLCLQTFEICAVDGLILTNACSMAGSDFEDNVQIACAVQMGVDAIVSRDVKGLNNPHVPVRSPDEIVALLANP